MGKNKKKITKYFISRFILLLCLILAIAYCYRNILTEDSLSVLSKEEIGHPEKLNPTQSVRLYHYYLAKNDYASAEKMRVGDPYEKDIPTSEVGIIRIEGEKKIASNKAKVNVLESSANGRYGYSYTLVKDEGVWKITETVPTAYFSIWYKYVRPIIYPLY